MNDIKKKPIKSSDPVVVEFLKYLGIDPESTIKVVITIETLKHVWVKETHRPTREPEK